MAHIMLWISRLDNADQSFDTTGYAAMAGLVLKAAYRHPALLLMYI
jgi:hypothetical protein